MMGYVHLFCNVVMYFVLKMFRPVVSAVCNDGLGELSWHLIIYVCKINTKSTIKCLKICKTRNSGRYAPFFLAPAVGWEPFGSLQGALRAPSSTV